MNRADIIARTIWLKQLAAAALQARDVLVDQLNTEAKAEFDEKGYASTWKIKGMASVTQPVSNDTIEVVDEPAFRAWIAKRYPTEVETITQVRPAWRTNVLENLARVAEDGVICLDDGEVIPGVKQQKGGAFLGISVTPEKGARAAFSAVANATLLELAARAEGATVLAEVTDGAH